VEDEMEKGPDQRFAELEARFAKLPAKQQEQALDGFAQVLTLCELPRETDESFAWSIGVERSSGVTHRSG
jgi:hypothetical protein